MAKWVYQVRRFQPIALHVRTAYKNQYDWMAYLYIGAHSWIPVMSNECEATVVPGTGIPLHVILVSYLVHHIPSTR